MKAVLAAALLLVATASTAAPRSPASAGALDTPEQVAAERAVPPLLRDPQVIAIQRQVEAELAATPWAASPEAKEQLRRAMPQWTASLILREQAAAPAILWTSDNTTHSWHGLTVPGRALSGDNPDNIYRSAFIDGAGRYEVIGRMDPRRRPAQFSFEVNRGTPGDMALNANKASKADFGNQIVMLTDKSLAIAPDGTFRITLGGAGEGRNHVRTPAEPLAIMVRDTLADWRQQPTALSIRRLDRPARQVSGAALRQRVLADLPGYLRFWGGFPASWYGGMAPNTVVGPIRRDGGWGYLAMAVFKLAPDEALVVRTTRGGASYTGSQLSDIWTITPDAQTHFTSLNSAQVAADPDGGITYVVAARDPGVGNWLETPGMTQGVLTLRWQGMPQGSTGADLLRGSSVMKLGEVAALPGVVRVPPGQRAARLRQRAADYQSRLFGPQR